MSRTDAFAPRPTFDSDFLLMPEYSGEAAWNLIKKHDSVTANSAGFTKDDIPLLVTMIFTEKYFVDNGDVMGFGWKHDKDGNVVDRCWYWKLDHDEGPEFKKEDGIWHVIAKDDENEMETDGALKPMREVWKVWREALDLYYIMSARERSDSRHLISPRHNFKNIIRVKEIPTSAGWSICNRRDSRNVLHLSTFEKADMPEKLIAVFALNFFEDGSHAIGLCWSDDVDDPFGEMRWGRRVRAEEKYKFKRWEWDEEGKAKGETEAAKEEWKEWNGMILKWFEEHPVYD
ncbi:uncharacterized protein BDZ99DRAFT_479051 [Mytilinidion resinicola]|uniref:Uncharacterized protein n=1 Tax=Mytilinidion resinicola TaxID=574789 RepID=A0A6A6YF00_9PEZI|nr:uncharacterized protein BDZ99DRAFT_479051 [Mytilinidion resinicola]KAF2806635.1 hypothetical protein BDZ99DRAFT_479051 [Mytilinidion resinicola]